MVHLDGDVSGRDYMEEQIAGEGIVLYNAQQDYCLLAMELAVGLKC